MDTLTTPANRSDRSHLRWVERALFMLGFLALGYFGYVQVETMLYQRFENQELDRILSAGPAATSGRTAAPELFSRPAEGTRIGRLEIPRLSISAIVLAGTDASTLRHSVGHIPGTAMPGAPGNVGLAGHRDTFFRRLKDVRPDDEIVFTTVDGVFRYMVEHTRIVNPADVWVLDPTERPALTLVTCYPFTYIGSAPQRFIVRAMQQSDAASTTSSSPGGTRPWSE